MSDFSHLPGTYIAEVPVTVRAGDVLPTGITAFVGTALAGPVNTPTFVTSLAEFKARFGDIHPSSDLSCAVAQFFSNGGKTAVIVRIGVSAGESVAADNIIGSSEAGTGLGALHGRFGWFDLLTVPGRAEPEIHKAMTKLAIECHAHAIIELPANLADVPAAVAWLSSHDAPRSANASVYFPRVISDDPAKPSSRRAFGGSGMIAGVYARIDAARGCWSPPAGKDALLKGATGPSYRVGERDAETLKSSGINTIKEVRGIGQVLWGARTLCDPRGGDSAFNFLPIARLHQFLARHIQHATLFFESERNRGAAITELQIQLELFMRRLFVQGAFCGTSPRSAYSVRCEGDIDNGVKVTISYAPLRPSEFISLTMTSYC